MSENKCPMPGCDGEIIYHGTEFGTDYDSWHGCTKCHFMCDLDHLPLIAAAMELAKATAAYAANIPPMGYPSSREFDAMQDAEERVIEVLNE